MSRAYIENLLQNDATLAGLGIVSSAVFNQHDIKERPRHDGPFIVIRWEESTVTSQTYTGMSNGLPRAPRVMTIWVHSPMEKSTDFEHIDRILDRIDSLLNPLEHAEGSDGYTITSVSINGRSGDLKDEAFMTICRNADYGVLYRRT